MWCVSSVNTTSSLCGARAVYICIVKYTTRSNSSSARIFIFQHSSARYGRCRAHLTLSWHVYCPGQAGILHANHFQATAAERERKRLRSSAHGNWKFKIKKAHLSLFLGAMLFCVCAHQHRDCNALRAICDQHLAPQFTFHQQNTCLKNFNAHAVKQKDSPHKTHKLKGQRISMFSVPSQAATSTLI